MKFLHTFVAVALGISTSLAVPIRGVSGPVISDIARARRMSDVDILNFALGLENLEVEFYRQGLRNFTQQDFARVNQAPYVRDRFVQILHNEETHKAFLRGLITEMGQTPAEPCQYKFPVTTVDEFVRFSLVLETAGTSAYSFASGIFADPKNTIIMAAMLGLESRQSAWISSAALHQNPWNTPFEAPLSFKKIATLAKPLVVSCPASNPPPIATSGPPLDIHPNTPMTRAHLAFPKPGGRNQNRQLYAAFIQGTGVSYVKLDMSNRVNVPQDLKGLVWVLVTAKMGSIADVNVVAGPAPMQFPFDARGRPIRVQD